VEKGQTIQWPQNTKGISRICKWKKDRQFNGHKIPKAYLMYFYQNVSLIS
jgi:hypothetical protein